MIIYWYGDKCLLFRICTYRQVDLLRPALGFTTIQPHCGVPNIPAFLGQEEHAWRSILLCVQHPRDININGGGQIHSFVPKARVDDGASNVLRRSSNDAPFVVQCDELRFGLECGGRFHHSNWPCSVRSMGDFNLEVHKGKSKKYPLERKRPIRLIGTNNQVVVHIPIQIDSSSHREAKRSWCLSTSHHIFREDNLRVLGQWSFR